jgi:GNAT superfamily N-acetyltransferase
LEGVQARHLAERELGEAMRLVERTFEELFAPDMYGTIHAAWPKGQFGVSDGRGLAGLLLSIKRSQFSSRILVMAVREELRGRGLGGELLHAFLRQCMLEGITEVVLEVRASNLPAQAFYGRYGFSRRSVLPRYYRDGEDAFVMARGVA